MNFLHVCVVLPTSALFTCPERPGSDWVSWSVSLKQLSNASAVSHPAGPRGERTSLPTSTALLCYPSLLVQQYWESVRLVRWITLARQWRAAPGCTRASAVPFSSLMCRKEKRGSNALACSFFFLSLACHVALVVWVASVAIWVTWSLSRKILMKWSNHEKRLAVAEGVMLRSWPLWSLEAMV